jgi:hypothetical protein
VNSRCWWVARAGSKLTRSHKRALECLPKPCAENGTSSTYVLAVLVGGVTDLIMQDKCYSSAVFPRVAHTHRCQVSPHSNPYHSVPITFSRCLLLILSGQHLQNPLAAPCTCVRACRGVSRNRWDSGRLVRGFYRRTVWGCDRTSRTARGTVYYRARGGWTGC